MSIYIIISVNVYTVIDWAPGSAAVLKLVSLEPVGPGGVQSDNFFRKATSGQVTKDKSVATNAILCEKMISINIL